MLGFVSAVLWRAAISKNDIYASLETDYSVRMQLRRVFETPDDRYTLATMAVSNLIDSKKRFSAAALSDVIVTPTRWEAKSAGLCLQSFFFIVHGLLFNFTMPPPSQSTGGGLFWAADTIKPKIRDQDIRKFPPVMRMLALPIKPGMS